MISALRHERHIYKKYNIYEIIFRRPSTIDKLVSDFKDVAIVGFSCFLWNINLSLEVAKKIRKEFPNALIVVGGPAVPKDENLIEDFFEKNTAVDVVCLEEGENVFVSLCRAYSTEEGIYNIPGIIYRDIYNNRICRTLIEKNINMESISSPYLDGTFDELYRKYKADFSGAILETNRGCPYKCAFCTWGNLSSNKIREKPINIVKKEIDWLGKNQIQYVAMTDANFGIKERDIEIAEYFVKCNQKYNCPSFISVSWSKHSPENILQIANILRKGKIGFRITQALQSFNQKALVAVNRTNICQSVLKN